MYLYRFVCTFTEEEFHIKSKVHCMGSHPLYGAVELVRVKPSQASVTHISWLARLFNSDQL